jgi:hypothetical protein
MDLVESLRAMFVFSFGVLSATRTEHGHSLTNKIFGCSARFAYWTLVVQKQPSSVPAPEAPDRGQNLQKATRWTTQNIAIEPMHNAESVPPSAASEALKERDNRRHEGNLPYFSADTD